MRVVMRFDLPWMTGYTTDNSANGITIPAGEYRRIKAGSSARGWVEFAGEQGSAGITVGIQKANDVVSPDAAEKVCAFKTTAGVGNPDATPTAVDLDGSKYVRPVFMLRSIDAVLAGGAFRGVVEILE
jgi:hypothetical protein